MAKVRLTSGDYITIRYNDEDDQHFIMSSWLRSFKNSNYAGPIQNNLYWKVYQQVIEQLLDRDGVVILIACNPEKETQIFGYIVVEENFETPVVHWLYVKQPFRSTVHDKWGIARALMGFCGISRNTEFYYTFRSASAGSLTASDGPWPRARFKPSIVRKKKGVVDETSGYLVQDPNQGLEDED